MCATSDRSLLVEAEAIAAAEIPGVRAARVPGGLFLALPLTWNEADRVCVRLSATDGVLRLHDDGGLVPAILASGLNPDGFAWRGALGVHGLDYDPATGRVSRPLDTLQDLSAQVLAMGRALLGLAEARPVAERLAA